MADRFGNQNVKHTEAGEMPDITKSGQALSRIRASLPAFAGTLKSPAVLVPAAISAVAITGYLFYRRKQENAQF